MRVLSDQRCVFPWLLTVVCVGMLCAGRVACGFFATAADELMVASSEEHVWAVVRDPSNRSTWRLVHHATGMDGAYSRVARTLDAPPRAMAARGNQVLLIMPPQLPSGTELDLLGLRVQQNVALETFFDVPLDGWDIYAGLSIHDRLAGVALGDSGPLVLTLPDQQDVADVRRTRGDNETTPTMAQLRRQTAYAWSEVPLPDPLHAELKQQLLPQQELTEASIIAPNADGATQLYTRAEGVWTSRLLGVPWQSIKRVARYQDRYAVALTSDEPGMITLGLERGGSVLPVLTVAEPETSWGLAAIADALLLITLDETGQLSVQTIDPLDGEPSGPVVWERPPLNVTEWLHLPILGMLVVAALLAIVLFRPSEAPDVPILAGVVPMGLVRRLIALGIDLVPGVVVATLVFDLELAEIALIDIVTSDMAIAGPGSLIIGITIAHELITELFTDRTIGKVLCGGVVVASTGGRPSRRAVLLRGLFKAVVLYAPILAVFVLLSPARQGVPETVSRTVVADARAARKPASSE